MRPIDAGWDSNTVIGIWEYLDNGPLHTCLRDLNVILPIIMTTNADMVLPVNLLNNPVII
jgi:hypothetical protein